MMDWCKSCRNVDRYSFNSVCNICEFGYNDVPTQYIGKKPSEEVEKSEPFLRDYSRGKRNGYK